MLYFLFSANCDDLSFILHRQWGNLQLLFRLWLADGACLHRTDVATTAMVRAAPVCLTGLGVTARAYVL
jgi:hypothetical protein